jgi:hypothetical protein
MMLQCALALYLKPISKQKVEYIFVAPPYCNVTCWPFVCPSSFHTFNHHTLLAMRIFRKAINRLK